MSDWKAQFWGEVRATARNVFSAGCILIDRLLPAQGVPVLAYHSIDDSGSPNSVCPATFRQQMTSLKRRGWATMSLDELLAAIRCGRLPEKRFVLTFDDGFENVFTAALPVLEGLGFAATLFIATGYVGGWNSFVKRRMPRLPMLTWGQVRTLQQCGWRVECHGHTHTDLTQIEAVQLSSELRTPRELIQAQTGVCPNHFCYPRGRYNDVVVAAVRNAGYHSALSLRVGLVRSKSSPWLLERLWVSDGTLVHFRALLTESYSLLAPLRRT